jgi:hypothetical protein
LLIYLDPEHEMNGVKTLAVSQMTAAGAGWLTWLLLGGGFAAAATARPARHFIVYARTSPSVVRVRNYAVEAGDRLDDS